MPRANRHFLPGHIWHITHLRSSQFQSFQPFTRFAPFKALRRYKGSRFKSSRKEQLDRTSKSQELTNADRGRYLRWAFEAKRLFGLSVLNYRAMSNHIHLSGQRHGRERYCPEHAAKSL